MKPDSRSLLPSLAVGLLVLLSVITAFVFLRAPGVWVDPSPEHILAGHESALYYEEAEAWARPLLPDPSARWPHLVLDEGCECGPVGQGVWRASGRVEVQPAPLPWEVYFRPDPARLLFARVGSRASGEAEEVRRITGRAP